MEEVDGIDGAGEGLGGELERDESASWEPAAAEDVEDGA
jgi:hypothetical protein